mgnify:CR=1 FL=1
MKKFIIEDCYDFIIDTDTHEFDYLEINGKMTF